MTEDEARNEKGEWTSGAGAHAEGTDKVGRQHVTLAGKITLGIKNPADMTNAELQKEYERTTTHGSAVNREFINAGRGMEKPSEMNRGDPMAHKYFAIHDRASALHDEAEYRNRMGGRRVVSDDGRVKFVGKQPGTLKSGFFQ